MKSITINGSERESVGKVSTRTLRNAGMVPCVLYGGKQPVHFSADERAFNGLVYTPNAHTVVIELEGGKSFEAILQDIQFHPVSDKILHIDFFELKKGKEITMEVPVVVEGSAPGVLEGGVLNTNLRKVKVRAIPKNLPDNVIVNVSELNIGNKFYVTQIETSNFVVLHPDNTVVCQVKTSRAAAKATTEDDAEVETEETAEAEA